MKKIILCGIALVAGLMSCTEDFTNWASPQSNSANEPIQTLSMMVQPTIGSIDFATQTCESIQLFTTNLVAGQTDGYTVVLSSDEKEATATIAANADGYVLTEDLSNAVSSIFGKAPVERTLNVTVSTIATAPTPDGDVKVRRIASPFTLKATLDVPYIATAYYLVGGPNSDWAASAAAKSIKFSHSGKDVYEDPIFSVVFDAAASGDTWFAFGDEEACDAIANNDWSKLFGCVGGNSQATSGQLDIRANMGKDNSFCVPAGAKKIKMVVNMLERTYEITQVNISESYYLIGGEKGWSEEEALTQPFSHSNQNVFDDPVFTYILKGGAERWFSFGDADALSAITKNNDWKQLYGYVDQQADKGKFARRCDMAGQPDNTFHVDGSAKFYRFSVNMLTLEYEITPLNFDPFIYYIGSTDGWSKAEQRLSLTDESGIYTGFLYCADPNGWGNEFKFQKVPGDWGTEINTGMMSGGITGDVADGGGNFKAIAGEGIYYFTLNMATNSLNAVRITNMNLVGDFNGWNQADDAQQMTWDAANYCFVITGAGVTANGWKFTANNAWGINLGGDINDLTQDGSNLSAVGTTIKLYPTRKTSDKIYCTVK